MVWVLLGEMFPNRMRAEALAVSGATNWLANLTVTVSFLPLLTAVGLRCLRALWSGCLRLSAFVWTAVRETKGKTLEEM